MYIYVYIYMYIYDLYVFICISIYSEHVATEMATSNTRTSFGTQIPMSPCRSWDMSDMR